MAGKRRFVDIYEAFWHYVATGEGCWNWTASVGNHGYGQLTFRQQKYTAHRLAWELSNGPVPDGLCVCHKCDNRRCCNPDHLFLGTRAENLEDMTRKGRRVLGSAHGRSKLSEEEVREIFSAGGSQKSIAERFGISQSMVSQIKLRQNWKHVEIQ